MSNINNQADSNDSQEATSPPSDEKMDTGSESFLSSQNTPNSVLSSDFDDQDQVPPSEPVARVFTDVLRLQNPPNNTTDNIGKSSDVLRLNNPGNDNEYYHNSGEFERYRDSKFEDDEREIESNFKNVYSDSPLRCDGFLNDSLMNQMSKLKIESPDVPSGNLNPSRPLQLGISPPRLTSTLTITSDHPLMGSTSPEGPENYPDIVPEKLRRVKPEDEVKDLSLSSVEDEKYATGGSFSDFYQDGPHRNTSKNNLYFTDNFSMAETHVPDHTSTPDVVRVQNSSYPPAKCIEGSNRRKIIPCFKETEHLKEERKDDGPRSVLGRSVDYSKPSRSEHAITAYVEERNKKLESGSVETEPLVISVSQPLDIPHQESDFGPVEWASSPSRLRSLGTMELPVEVSSHTIDPEECASPDALSSSTEHSAYRAAYEPASGAVALRHNPACANTSGRRRIIAVMDTEDRCSVDSASVSSLRSEEAEGPAEAAGSEGPEGPDEATVADDDIATDDDSRRNTRSDSSSPIPEYSYAEERARSEERAWRRIPLAGGGHLLCDMKVIEPYKRVLSHGGYTEPSRAHVIVFSACHLPDSGRADYSYVMDNLFLYVVWTLDRLVTDEYELVYLHGSASRHRMPNFHWLKKSYHLIDRRLRKSLKHLYLVHPTFWLKSIVFMSKPFISTKFSRKISYVHSLGELFERVKVEPAAIPDAVRDFDRTRHR